MTQSRQACLQYLEKIRWGGTPKCPYCESTNSTEIKPECRYHCNSCFNSYSVTVGTLFHKTHVDLAKWFVAIKLVMKSSTTITVRELAIQIGVNKNTASYMIARIRNAMIEESELLQKLIHD
jgi:transposase-like protein